METASQWFKDLHGVIHKHCLTKKEFPRLTAEFANIEQPTIPDNTFTQPVFSVLVILDPSNRWKSYIAILLHYKRHVNFNYFHLLLSKNTH